jgi:hypothetical protein
MLLIPMPLSGNLLNAPELSAPAMAAFEEAAVAGDPVYVSLIRLSTLETVW